MSFEIAGGFSPFIFSGGTFSGVPDFSHNARPSPRQGQITHCAMEVGLTSPRPFETPWFEPIFFRLADSRPYPSCKRAVFCSPVLLRYYLAPPALPNIFPFFSGRDSSPSLRLAPRRMAQRRSPVLHPRFVSGVLNSFSFSDFQLRASLYVSSHRIAFVPFMNYWFLISRRRFPVFFFFSSSARKFYLAFRPFSSFCPPPRPVDFPLVSFRFFGRAFSKVLRFVPILVFSGIDDFFLKTFPPRRGVSVHFGAPFSPAVRNGRTSGPV